MAEATCLVAECDRPPRTRGWCKMHYERWRTKGTTAAAPKPPDPGCQVSGCSGRHRSLGYCEVHYFRYYRKGTPDATYEPGHQTLQSNGYYSFQIPGHPLANDKGRVSVHRAVLYEAIGPGEHPCHWCGYRVRWDWVDRRGMLNVDHVDNDKTNNELSNLVPSCTRCNSTRTKNPEWFADNVMVARDMAAIAYALPF